MGLYGDEDWGILLGLLPPEWEALARNSGAVHRLRGFDSVEAVLRVLLMHVGCGCSLRETAVRAQRAGLAEVSDVTLLNRLRQAESWLLGLCQHLLQDSGVKIASSGPGRRVRVVDGTVIRESGRTGSQWRIHYSLRLPDLSCDECALTPVKGVRTGEGLERFHAAAGDLFLADRGYSRAAGIGSIIKQGGAVVVRLNTASLRLFDAAGRPFPLLNSVQQIQEPGVFREWPVCIHDGQTTLAGRLCAVRKSELAIQRAQRRLTRNQQQGRGKTKPETRIYAAYILVFTTLPAAEADAAGVLEWYRLRWQIELVFKRLKSLLQLGQLPKHDEHSIRAWLYGKLLAALLVQKLIHLGTTFSPWGYDLRKTAHA